MELYEDDLKDRLLLLSFQTVAEMLAGAELKGWGRKRAATALAEGHTLIAHDGAFRHVPDLDLICRVP